MGWIWTASNRSQIGAWDATVEALERHGVNVFQLLSPERVTKRTGSGRNIAGVFEPGLASVQPAAVARALRLVALDRGVRIHERSPMTALERSATPVVRTAGGSVRARRVVLAMNAWAGTVRELRSRYLTVGSDILITEPILDRLDEIGIEDVVLISDSRLLVHYYHVTPDRRLVFGKPGGTLRFGNTAGDEYDRPSQREAWVKSALSSFYPQLADAPVAATWLGPVDRSMDGLPFFSRLGRSDIIAGLGYSGNGVGPSVLGGKILASMALDRWDKWSSCGLVREPPSRVPPEPLRHLCGTLVRGAVARKERAEDQGRTPSRIDRVMVRLAPPGLVPTNGRRP